MPQRSQKNDASNGNIKDFFKPFTIPRRRISNNDDIGDEIVVARPPTTSQRTPVSGRKTPQLSQSSSALSSLSSTPTKPGTPVTLRQKRPLQLDGASDLPLSQASTTSSQFRVLHAVEIPVARSALPKPRLSDVNPGAAGPVPANTSFTSSSTLSSVPSTSTMSSSRRIIKNGIQAITNSDSGSADSSSEEELADFSTFIARKRPRLTPPTATDNAAMKHSGEAPDTVRPVNRLSARLSGDSRRSSQVSTPLRRSPSPPPTAALKYSLMNLVKQREKDERNAAKLKEMEERYAAVDRKREDESRHEREAMGIKAAVADDSDEGERMMLAIQRTEAYEEEESFFYLRGQKSILQNRKFPAIERDVGSKQQSWVKRMTNEKWRHEACLSGFLAQLAAKHGLSHSVRVWLANELVHEEREDLCDAYVHILEVCSNNGHCTAGPTNDDGGDLKNCSLNDFYELHTLDATDIPAVDSPRERSPQLMRRMFFVLRAIRAFNVCHTKCLDCPRSTCLSTISELLFLYADANIGQSSFLKQLLDDTMEALLEHASKYYQNGLLFQPVASCLFSSKLSDQLKCRAIAALPAYTGHCHTLKWCLALTILEGKDHLSPLLPSEHGEALLSRLKAANKSATSTSSKSQPLYHDPFFTISEATDYNLLNAVIPVLDFAIDSGFQDLDEVGEKEFNSHIDGFITQLNLMASRIRDAGTTHLRRTQAKGAIERLAKRLEYSVRTKPRPRKDAFGSSTSDAMLEGFMDRFLKDASKKTDSAVKGSGEMDAAPGAVLGD